jgi:hypothetical protein
VSELLGCEIERKGIDAGKSIVVAESVTRWKSVAGWGQKEVSSISIREGDAGGSKVRWLLGQLRWGNAAVGCTEIPSTVLRPLSILSASWIIPRIV